jgi:hypothetical protein
MQFKGTNMSHDMVSWGIHIRVRSYRFYQQSIKQSELRLHCICHVLHITTYAIPHSIVEILTLTLSVTQRAGVRDIVYNR